MIDPGVAQVIEIVVPYGTEPGGGLNTGVSVRTSE
jgi:hypothetical protein